MRGFVDEEQADSGKAAAGGFDCREGRRCGRRWGTGARSCCRRRRGDGRRGGRGSGGFADQLGGLALGGAEDEDEAVGLMPGGEDGLGGGEGGLAPLAGAVEDDLPGTGGEDVGLLGVGLKARRSRAKATGSSA